MDKMNTRRFAIILIAPLVYAPVAFGTGPAVPEQGLKAEMDQRWQDAVMVYLSTLRADPKRADLWVRVADVRVRLGRDMGAVHALENAVRIAPKRHALFFRLSKAYAATDQPEKALVACRRAIALDGDNVDHLRACGEYAEWAGDLEASQDIFRRVLIRAPEDQTALLGLARARSWAGKLDKAARDYRAYLKQYPANRDALFEYARVEAWRGDFPAALEVLENIRERFGVTERYRQEKARFLAWAGRPTASKALLDSLLERHPEDYELNYTRTVNLYREHRVEEALGSLVTLQRLRPDAKETDDIVRTVRTPTRSSLDLGVSYYNDSNQIRIRGMELYGTLGIRPRTKISAGIEHQALRAKLDTGLETIDGEERISDSKIWLGGRHRFSPTLALEGRVGRGTIEGEPDDYRLYRLRADLQLGDNLAIWAGRERDLFALSPRSVSLGIKQEGNKLGISWEPSLRYVLEAETSYDTLSDDNLRRELLVAPRRTMLRREKINLDLGVSGQWLRFDKDLDHGYYDPQNYRRYALTAFGYWKISEDDGVSLVASAGLHKDEDFTDFKFGGDLVAVGTFGLYRDWMGRIRIDYSDRYQEAGSYDGMAIDAILTRRF